MNPFGSLGVWMTRGLAADVTLPAAREAERLGYETFWLSGGRTPAVFDEVEAVLAATEQIKVATGIVNIWVETPESTTEAYQRLEAAYPGRLYVGIGISHAPLVAEIGLDYSRPLATTRAFLDGLDAQPDPVPVDRRIVAALGPKMLRLAAERSLGTHPYLVTTDNTAAAREGTGPDGVVAAELGVVLEPDLDSARGQGRRAIARYFGMPNYTNNWRRAGFTDADLADGGSDRLIDAVLALGDAGAIRQRIAAHRAAGADHICVQVLGDDPDRIAVLQALAPTR